MTAATKRYVQRAARDVPFKPTQAGLDDPAEIEAHTHPVMSQAVLASLKGYHIAKERAARCNRNLLQYGAAIVAVLGIGVGSGTVLALANAISEAPGSQGEGKLIDDLDHLVVAGVALSLAVVVGILAMLLCRAFALRLKAESAADAHLASLISADPSRYWPAGS